MQTKVLSITAFCGSRHRDEEDSGSAVIENPRPVVERNGKPQILMRDGPALPSGVGPYDRLILKRARE
jgi:hypothetical protein